MIVDFHTHVWPDRLASKALAASSRNESLGDGKVKSLVRVVKESSVDLAVCLGIAAIPAHVDPTNRFQGALPPPLIGFGAVHAELSVEENLASLRNNNCRGIKLNPPFQGFSLADSRILALLDAVRGEFVVVAHVGEGGAHGTSAMCTPEHIKQIAQQLPGLDIVAAHLGGLDQLDEAEAVLRGLDVYLDTSWPPTVAEVGGDRLKSLIRNHGPERIVFASDWPNGDPQTEIQVLSDLGLPDSDLDLILGGNAQRLLHLA